MAQLGFFENDGQQELISRDIFDYKPAVFSLSECTSLLKKFIDEVPWEQRRVMMYGREIVTPRLTAWYGDGADYPVRDKPNAHPWTPELSMIRARIEPLADVNFDSVLLNYYRDGNDSVAWHDDEDGIPGKNMIVASVSFGQERVFDIRSKADHKQKVSILLANGSYLLMKGNFQRHYDHRIAKSAKPMGPRINLTFRQLIK